jgi:hypothetical protein
MALGKHKRVSSARATRTAMRVGNWASLARASRVARGRVRPLRGRLSLSYMNRRLQAISRTIETKDNVWKSNVNVALPHNQLHQVQNAQGGRLNIFQVNRGPSDNMVDGGGQRIGDEITVARVILRGMLENALGRPKVHYRVMVIRSAKGDTPTRDTLFGCNANNKLIDGINRERYMIIAQKIITISPSNPEANSVTSAGVPLEAPQLVTGNACCWCW